MQEVYLEVDCELDNHEKLWRYMDLSKFISLIEKKAIWLARADTFRDKHEGRFPDEMKSTTEKEKAYQSFEVDARSLVKDADDFLDYLQKNTFVSCWHKNFDENMVMWEIYGRDTNAVAIQTTVERLKESVAVTSSYGYSALGMGQPTPIVLTRHIAATRIEGRQREFLLDSAGAGGMSGGPVFVETPAGFFLVGLYTGLIYPDHVVERNERVTALGTCCDMALCWKHLALEPYTHANGS